MTLWKLFFSSVHKVKLIKKTRTSTKTVTISPLVNSRQFLVTGFVKRLFGSTKKQTTQKKQNEINHVTQDLQSNRFIIEYDIKQRHPKIDSSGRFTIEFAYLLSTFEIIQSHSELLRNILDFFHVAALENHQSE